MKITIYTITTCQFSKQEKEYLSSHGLQFEEKNLETNREFLTEMLAVGGNFAGTPVTKIEKDDGQIAVLKGFTAADFDKTLGFVPSAEKKQDAAPAAQNVAQATAPDAQPAVVVAPSAPTPDAAPVAPPQPEVTQPPVQDPAMASVLNTLEQQAVATPPAPVAPVMPEAPAAPVAGTPVIPDPQF